MGYFQEQNEQLVLLKNVVTDLRDYLDVEEGLRCLIWGKPTAIPQDKIPLYMSYLNDQN